MKVVYCDEGFWVDTDKLEEIDGEMVAPEICEDDINEEIERLTDEVAEKDKRIEELEAAINEVKSTLVGCILIRRDGDPPLFTMWLDGHVLTPDLTNYVIIPAERYGEPLRNGDGTLVGVQEEVSDE